MLLGPVDPDTLTGACGADPSFVCRLVFEQTDSEAAAEAAEFLLATPLRILFVLLVAWVARRLLRRVIDRFVRSLATGDQPSQRLKRKLRDTPLAATLPPRALATGEVPVRAAARAETLGNVLQSLAGFVIWVLAALTILGELGINLGPLVAGAGVAGIAIGFGAQRLVRDFLAGLFILIEDQYGVGDVIDAGAIGGTPVVGTVEEVTLRITRLRGDDGIVWYVPNGELLRVGNRNQQWGRAIVDVVVGPAADLGRVREVLYDAAVALWREERWANRILHEPEVTGVEELTADGPRLQVLVQTVPAARLSVERELRARLKQALDDADVPGPMRP